MLVFLCPPCLNERHHLIYCKVFPLDLQLGPVPLSFSQCLRALISKSRFDVVLEITSDSGLALMSHSPRWGMSRIIASDKWGYARWGCFINFDLWTWSLSSLSTATDFVKRATPCHEAAFSPFHAPLCSYDQTSHTFLRFMQYVRRSPLGIPMLCFAQISATLLLNLTLNLSWQNQIAFETWVSLFRSELSAAISYGKRPPKSTFLKDVSLIRPLLVATPARTSPPWI